MIATCGEGHPVIAFEVSVATEPCPMCILKEELDRAHKTLRAEAHRKLQEVANRGRLAVMIATGVCAELTTDEQNEWRCHAEGLSVYEDYRIAKARCAAAIATFGPDDLAVVQTVRDVMRAERSFDRAAQAWYAGILKKREADDVNR